MISLSRLSQSVINTSFFHTSPHFFFFYSGDRFVQRFASLHAGLWPVSAFLIGTYLCCVCVSVSLALASYHFSVLPSQNSINFQPFLSFNWIFLTFSGTTTYLNQPRLWESVISVILFRRKLSVGWCRGPTCRKTSESETQRQNLLSCPHRQRFWPVQVHMKVVLGCSNALMVLQNAV